MKATIKLDQLREAASQAFATLDRNATAVTSWLYLLGKNGKDQRVYLFSTDLVSRTLIRLDAEVEAEGEVLISPQLFLATLANVGGEEQVKLSLSESGNQLRVQVGKSRSVLGVNADAQSLGGQVRSMPFEAKSTCSVPAKALLSLLHRSVFCTLPEAHSPLNGVRLYSVLGGLCVSATDRIVAVDARTSDENVKDGFSVTIARRSLQSLQRLLSQRKDATVDMFVSEGKVYFRIQDVFYGTGIIDFQWPESFRKLVDGTIPKNNFSVNRKLLQATLQRAAAFALEDGVIRFLFEPKDQAVQLTAMAKEKRGEITDVIPGIAGPAVKAKVALSLSHLQNVIGALHTDEVMLGVTDEKSHVRVCDSGGSDSSSVYIISPVRW